MDDLPLVSVIVPVYNGERYLAETVGSALKQTYRPIEIIVVDDGSTDNSGQIAQRFGSPVRYCWQTHGGIGAARNRGVDLSRGEYFAFLDADDLWIENKLALQTAALRKDPALDIGFAHVRHFHSPELPQVMRDTIRCPPEAMPGYCPTTMLVTRSAFFRVGPFEVSWRVGEFIDWYARALQAGFKSALLPEAVAERRLHNANQGIVERAAQSDYLRILKAALDRRREAPGQTSGENSARPGKS